MSRHEKQLLNEVRQLCQQFDREGGLPPISSHLFLKSGEQAFYSSSCNLWETRSVRNYQSGGAGFRIAKGIYVGGSKGKSVSNQELTRIDEGTLVVTNKRVVFDGATTDRTIILNKIMSLNKDSSAVELSIEGRQKSLYFEVGNAYILDAVLRVCIGAENPADFSVGDGEIALDTRYGETPSKAKPPRLPHKGKRNVKREKLWIIAIFVAALAFLTFTFRIINTDESDLSAGKQRDAVARHPITTSNANNPAQVVAEICDVTNIGISKPLWINADEDSDMHLKFSVTNNHSFPVTNVVVKFEFQDVVGRDLGGAKIKTLNEIFKADEVQEILKLSLDDYPSETIKVIAEVISVSPHEL
jgi:hypothetical protein